VPNPGNSVFADLLSNPKLQKLTESLGQKNIRLVGGCVRDAAIGHSVHDIDIATVLLPDTVMDLARNFGLKAIPTGLKHGTVTIVVDHQPFEVTTLRRDLKTDGRHAEVSFTDDWVEDAARRDFTMNAMSLSLSGELFDPFSGMSDAQSGTVRFVGDTANRIREDYLRILRYFRFQSEVGNIPMEPSILATVREHRAGLDQLSGERIWQEFKKTLVGKNVLNVIGAMEKTGVLRQLFGSETSIQTLVNLRNIEAQIWQPIPLRSLASLLQAYRRLDRKQVEVVTPG
jgi:poly(A) polymerase